MSVQIPTIFSTEMEHILDLIQIDLATSVLMNCKLLLAHLDTDCKCSLKPMLV